jgi:hypothetical protein
MIQSSYNKPIAPKASPEVKSKSASSAKPKDLEGSLEAQDFDNELKAATSVDEKPVAETASGKSQKSEKKNEAETKEVKISPEMMLETPADVTNIKTIQPETGSEKTFDSSLTKGVQDILHPKKAEAAPVNLSNEQVIKLAKGDVGAVEVEVMAAAMPIALSEEGFEVQNLIPGEAKAPTHDGKVLPKEIQAQTEASVLKGEVHQAMLKTPQVQVGRSPAIEFAQSEIDPQLLGNEDFVAQKNLVVKKNLNTSVYGIKPQTQKMAMENGLNQSQIVKDVTAVEAGAQGAVNSQQFILNLQNDQKPMMNETQAPQKVFDMSNIKSTNSTQIMDQVSNYIVQAKAAKEPTVTMRVNHEQLGLIDITVNKSMTVGQDAVAINIGAHSAEGKNFFQQNSKDLFAHLTSAGVNVSDFKVDTPSQTAKNDFDMNQQSGRQGSEGKQFGSEQNQRKHDSDRRQDLWKLLADKEAA